MDRDMTQNKPFKQTEIYNGVHAKPNAVFLKSVPGMFGQTANSNQSSHGILYQIALYNTMQKNKMLKK